MDTVEYIQKQTASIVQLIEAVDSYMPDEDMVEVLIGAFSSWGTIEAELLYTAVETAFEGSLEVVEPARERLNTLYALQENIHLGEAADAPFSLLARQYVDGVKYHLAVDAQQIAPLVAQLPDRFSHELAASMAAMKLELE
jgi:hypothetical protein